MPGPVLHIGARIQCAHAGQATVAPGNPRVLVGGKAVLVQTQAIATITGCTLPSNSGGPCVSGQYVTGATRVTVMGQPIVLLDSQGVCAPTGTPLINLSGEPRVTAM